MKLWCPIMYRDEADMLECRLEAFRGREAVHVISESPFTHRGVPKPLLFLQAWANRPVEDARTQMRHVVDDWEPDPDPWVNEHVQRNRAWPVIDAEAADDDVVLIADCDEIPSPELLDFLPLWASSQPWVPLAIPMRTFLFAVDWEVATRVPPPCVAATVRQLRERAQYGHYLAEVRDDRESYPAFHGFGGWHFSWVGGPERQKAKLETSTCHTEILATPEADLIRSGARWRTAEDGGGLPVRPVEVDETWPAYVYEHRCPPEWFRPRSCDACAAGNHTACSGSDGLSRSGCQCHVQGLDEAHDWTAEFAGDEL